MYDAVLRSPFQEWSPVNGKGGLYSRFLAKPFGESFPVEDGYSPRKAIDPIREEARLRVLSSALDDDAWTQMTEHLMSVGLHGSLRVA